MRIGARAFHQGQATDTKLNRQVALKILPEAFATPPPVFRIVPGTNC